MPEPRTTTIRSQILIVQTAFLGDVLLGIPFFKELRKIYPESEITLFARRGVGSLIRDLGFADRVIEVDKSKKGSWPQAILELRKSNYQLIFSPHESFRSLSIVARLKADRKIGYTGGVSRFVFTDRVERPLNLPEALRQLALLQPFDEKWNERLSEYASKQTAPGGLDSHGLKNVPEWASMQVAAPGGAVRENVVVMAPGSVWPTKMWGAARYAELASIFVAEGARVKLLGSNEERAICDEIVRLAPGTESLAGKTTLAQSIEVLQRARLAIVNDSGAMHLASVAGTPSVAMFGPTVLDFGYRPWQNQARVVEIPKSELACRPCGKHGAVKCPIGTHDCMRMIVPKAVRDAARELEK